jgi:DNA-binding SARP family transcriptional activator/tetratricopeptide (TPR) repeat protein
MSFLIMNSGTDAARERLIDIFWPDADPEHARDSLNTALHSVRRCLRTSAFEVDRFLLVTKSVIRWIAETDVDANEFRQLVAREEPAADIAALRLYRGDFLEGDYDNWSVQERERIASLYETVLARVVRSSGDVESARRFIARNPYEEDVYATLIEAELAAGSRASAASWLVRCRRALAEIGEKPSAAFESRFKAIENFEPSASDEPDLPFAGRESELAILAVKFGAQAAQGSITIVHGEAGIGKSALLERSTHIAAEHSLRVLQVRCATPGPNTFGPWRDLFAAVGAGDFDAFVRANSTDIAAAVAQAIAARLTAPTALFVDDAHELTGDALDIFVAFARIAALSHAVIAAVRPEGLGALRSLFADMPFDELPVGHLERADLRWALAQSLGDDRNDVFDVLYSRTGGHPLFFNGLLSTLVSSGVLARDGRIWRLTKAIEPDVMLPDTVRRFIGARLHARGDIPHAVACVLALEPLAKAGDLSAALGFDEPSVLDALDDLLALGLIVQPSSGAQFAFAHGLIADVAAAGLNAGRRAAVHRALAQRLKTSDELGASLRRASHLDAAGERLEAARSYLRSAEEALELNAAQDAGDRCDAGLRVIQQVERSIELHAVLAKLYKVAARAAFARGDVEDAIASARNAVMFAEAAGDLRESTLATIDVAVMEGAASLFVEQKSEADHAVRNAIRCGDIALEALALVQQAGAARELGLREVALPAGLAAHDLAIQCDRLDIAQSATAEILRAQMTWWQFGEALRTANVGREEARRAGPLAEAAFLHTKCSLSCLLDRFDEARSQVAAAIGITTEVGALSRLALVAPIDPVPILQFRCHFTAARIAAASGKWDEALDAVERAASLKNVARLPRHRERIALLRIQALLHRDGVGDNDAARAVSRSLDESPPAQGSGSWSDSRELARACVAARIGERADIPLRRALDALEENAHHAPLDADRAFAFLEEAASQCGNARIAAAAGARSRYFRSQRIAAAGAAWGGPAASEIVHAGMPNS